MGEDISPIFPTLVDIILFCTNGIVYRAHKAFMMLVPEVHVSIKAVLNGIIDVLVVELKAVIGATLVILDR